LKGPWEVEGQSLAAYALAIPPRFGRPDIARHLRVLALIWLCRIPVSSER
jgi:hypothetical protein